MNSINSVIVEGNLVRDPVISETPKGTKVCNFTIASNRFYKQDDEYQKEVSFLDVEAWAKLATICDSGLLKGKGARVVGRLKQDRWDDKEGNPRSRIKVVAEHVDFKPIFSKDASAEEVAQVFDSEKIEAESEIVI
ncbi:MAG: single-stranded DNA-binding protein [Spirochaetales bacterium]|nr:single-stranded DNA-binding protein [Spirochaetales bacterium]